MKKIILQFSCTFVLSLIFTICNCEVISNTEISPLEMNGILQTIDSYFFGSKPRFDLEVRKFIRAAFHDCMGGCDGSLNTTNPANKGLQHFAKVISNAYDLATNPQATENSHSLKKLSRADFWALSAQRAAAWGFRNGAHISEFTGKPTFYYGRVSQPSGTQNDPHEGEFPRGEQNWQDMLKSIHTGIPTLTQYDIVALLGFHASGTVSLKNSGYSAPMGQFNALNSNYYKNLMGYRYPQDKFLQVKAQDSWYEKSDDNGTYEKIQWVHPKNNQTPAMMMPIDMMVYLSFHVNSTGGTNDGEYCPQGNNQTLYNCSDSNTATKIYLPLAPTAEQAFKYAKDNDVYMNEAIPIFIKMVNYVNPSVPLTPFEPKLGCVGGVLICLGDIFFTGCGAVTTVC